MAKKLLIVEDDKNISFIISENASIEGYECDIAYDGEDGLQKALSNDYDLILLDLMLPKIEGFEICRQIRREKIATPVIMLTAWGETVDRIKGLRAGANDYLGKPFEYEELQTRIEAVIRSVEQMPQIITRRNLILKTTSMAAFLGGEDMLLSQKEFALLLLFAQYEGRFMSAEYLYEQVWGQSMLGDDNAVKVTVSKLRTKLGGSGYSIIGKRGEGYCFQREG